MPTSQSKPQTSSSNKKFFLGILVGVAAAAGVHRAVSAIRHALRSRCCGRTDSQSQSTTRQEPAAESQFAEYSTLNAAELHAFAIKCLVEAGCSHKNAKKVADVLLAVRRFRRSVRRRRPMN